MNKKNQMAISRIGFVLCAVLAGALTGCAGRDDGPRGGGAYIETPSQSVQPDYVYYPGYEVYYSGNTRQYVYREGSSWVSRPTPPRVSADVLLGSPSVRLDFHDHPSNHHATVARQYPKSWAPQAQSNGGNQGHDKRD